MQCTVGEKKVILDLYYCQKETEKTKQNIWFGDFIKETLKINLRSPLFV